MEGGPSHVDLFDPKPELTRQHGKPLPASFGKVLTPMGTGGNNLLASKRKFAKHGQSGLDFSRLAAAHGQAAPTTSPSCGRARPTGSTTSAASAR